MKSENAVAVKANIHEQHECNPGCVAWMDIDERLSMTPAALEAASPEWHLVMEQTFGPLKGAVPKAR